MSLSNKQILKAINLIDEGYVRVSDFTLDVQQVLIEHFIRLERTDMIQEILDNCDVPADSLTIEERLTYYQLFVKGKTL